MKIASSPGEAFPVWYDGRHINESRFCQQYLLAHQLCYTEGAFFTPEGCMTDEMPLKVAIFQQVEPYAALSVARKITGILELLKIMAHVEELPPRMTVSTCKTARCIWTEPSARKSGRLSAAAFPWPIVPTPRSRKPGSASWRSCCTRRISPPSRNTWGTA